MCLSPQFLKYQKLYIKKENPNNIDRLMAVKPKLVAFSAKELCSVCSNSHSIIILVFRV